MVMKWLCLNIFLLILGLQTGTAVWAETENIKPFVHVNLVPMTKETILSDQTVLVKGPRIAAIGPSNRIDIPKDSVVIKSIYDPAC